MQPQHVDAMALGYPAAMAFSVLRFDMRWIDQDFKAMRQSYIQGDFRRDVAIIGNATADNGLSYGFNYDVDKNRAELHLSNRFGRLTVGNTATATDSLDVQGSSVLVGRGHYAGGGSVGLLNGLIPGLGQVSHTRPQGIPGIPMGFQGGPTIRYTTPNYGGLTVAFSYTNQTRWEKSGREDDGDGFHKFHAEDVWSAAAQYTSSYGNYTTVVYGGYEFGNRTLKEDIAFGFHEGHHDTEIWSVGAKVTGMGAGFAAGFGERKVDHNETFVIPGPLIAIFPPTFDDVD